MSKCFGGQEGYLFVSLIKELTDCNKVPKCKTPLW